MKMTKWYILLLLSFALMLLPTTLIAHNYGWKTPTQELPIELNVLSIITLVVGTICVFLVVVAGTVDTKYGKDK